MKTPIDPALARLATVKFTQVQCPTCGAKANGAWCKCPSRKGLARKVSNILAAHFTVAERPCNGDAHKPGVDVDHCMVCMPNWGTVQYLTTVVK